MRRFGMALFLVFSIVGSSSAAGLPRKSMIGLAVAPIPADTVARYRLADTTGILVTAVVPESPGAKAGFKAGDLILTQDGAPAPVQGFPQRIAATPAGSKLHFEVLRAGKKQSLQATLAERPRDPGNEWYRVDYGDVTSLGHRLRTITSHPRSAGRHPALLYLPGLTPASFDFALSATNDEAILLSTLANADIVTMRVDKPGTGDSEGGAYSTLDFATEADAYRQGLVALRQMPDVDTSRVFLFGHSLGGCYAPLLASETSVRGVAVYGTLARTWHEYLLDVVRFQGLLSGQSYAQVDDSVRVTARMLELVLEDGQSPEQVAQARPELAGLVAENFPGDLYFGRSLAFWRQIFATNLASLWARSNTHVLVVHGASDYVSYAADHELIAKIVEQAHPGWARYESPPNSDHWMHEWPTEAESEKHAGTGTFNPAFAKMLLDWIKEGGNATR